jgi:hypothetical protein
MYQDNWIIKTKHCHMLGTRHRGSIGNLIYWTHKLQLQAILKLSVILALDFSLQHTKSPQFVSTSRCYVTASNNVDSSASMFTSLPPGDGLTDNPLLQLIGSLAIVTIHSLATTGHPWLSPTVNYYPLQLQTTTRCTASGRTKKKTPFPTVALLLRVYSWLWKCVYQVVTKQWRPSSVIMSQYI